MYRSWDRRRRHMYSRAGGRSCIQQQQETGAGRSSCIIQEADYRWRQELHVHRSRNRSCIIQKPGQGQKTEAMHKGARAKAGDRSCIQDLGGKLEIGAPGTEA